MSNFIFVIFKLWKSVYNMDIVNMNMNMNMNMDDVIEEIDRICGYGEEGHVNKDTVPKEIELLDKKEYTEQEGQ